MENDDKPNEREVYPGVSPERFELDRLYARWLMAGQPNKDTVACQAWLKKYGYPTD